MLNRAKEWYTVNVSNDPQEVDAFAQRVRNEFEVRSRHMPMYDCIVEVLRYNEIEVNEHELHVLYVMITTRAEREVFSDMVARNLMSRYGIHKRLARALADVYDYLIDVLHKEPAFARNYVESIYFEVLTRNISYLAATGEMLKLLGNIMPLELSQTLRNADRAANRAAKNRIRAPARSTNRRIALAEST